MTTAEKIAYLNDAKKKQNTYRAQVFEKYGDCSHSRNIAVLCDHHIRLMDRDIARLENAGFSDLEKSIQQFAAHLIRK